MFSRNGKIILIWFRGLSELGYLGSLLLLDRNFACKESFAQTNVNTFAQTQENTANRWKYCRYVADTECCIVSTGLQSFKCVEIGDTAQIHRDTDLNVEQKRKVFVETRVFRRHTDTHINRQTQRFLHSRDTQWVGQVESIRWLQVKSVSPRNKK